MKDTVQDNGFFAGLFNCVSSLGDLFMSANVLLFFSVAIFRSPHLRQSSSMTVFVILLHI